MFLIRNRISLTGFDEYLVGIFYLPANRQFPRGKNTRKRQPTDVVRSQRTDVLKLLFAKPNRAQRHRAVITTLFPAFVQCEYR